MGVSGSGKTTVAQALEKRLHWPFLEGDALHPPENIAKMASGTPLTDLDREPWLARIAQEIRRWSDAGQPGIVTCSALRRAYRHRLLDGVPSARVIYLKGEPQLLLSRMQQRKGHFMPSMLLDSQLETLEEPTPDERPIVCDIAHPLDETLDEIVRALAP